MSLGSRSISAGIVGLAGVAALFAIGRTTFADFTWTSIDAYTGAESHTPSLNDFHEDFGSGLPLSILTHSSSSTEVDAANWCTAGFDAFATVNGLPTGLLATTRASGVAGGAGSLANSASGWASSLMMLAFESDEAVSMLININVLTNAGDIGVWEVSVDDEVGSLTGGAHMLRLSAGVHTFYLKSTIGYASTGGSTDQFMQLDTSFTIIPAPSAMAVVALAGARGRGRRRA